MLSSNNDILLYLDKLSRKLKHIQCCLNNNAFTFTYGTEDPVDPLNPVSSNGLYLRTDTGDLWEWNGIGWTFIYNFSSGGGTQDLQSVLDQGHSAVNQIIELFGDNSYINVYATDNVVTSSFGVDTEPKILLTNSLGYKITLRAALVSGNTVEFPANSGTLALLSDIPPATPTVISTKTTTYTLQLADADFDTLFEMDAATDEQFIIDSAEAFPIGTSFIFARRGAGEVNIVAAGATVILSANGATNLTYVDSGATLIKVSATEWYLFGDIGAPVIATPGGSDREIQFNDGGTAFGGATGFSYDPTNTHGLVELVSTDDTKSLFSIQGPSTSSNIFEVANEANPGVGDYFRVGANTGYMSGVWTISNGGQLNVATGAVGGLIDMIKLTNAVGIRTIALSLSDDNTFAIRDTVAAVNRIEVSPTGDVAIKALDTDSAAPSTTGTVKMVVCDNTGKLSNKPDPHPYQSIVGTLNSVGPLSFSFIELTNDTGITYTGTRNSDGNYTLTANSGTPFTTNKTFVFISPTDPTGTFADLYFRDYYVSSTTTINFLSNSLAFGPSDTIFQNTLIEIRIYP